MIKKKIGPKARIKEDEFEVILLDGTQLTELTEEDKAYLEKFTNAKTLTLCFCSLKNLKNLPVLPKVEMLDLSDNMLTGEDLGSLYQCFKKLKSLILANNCIRDRDLSHIQALVKCQNLTSLDLSANPLTEMQSYRENVFEKLGQLEALDGFDKEGNEWSVMDAEELRQDDDWMITDTAMMGE